MTLRRAGPDYPRWAAVADLIRGAFAYMETRLGHPARATALTADDLIAAAGKGAVFLAEEEGMPVACLFTRPSRDRARALYLGWLAVAESRRGQGLARKLITAAEAEANAGGYAEMTLDTGAVLTELHTQFRHFGFEITGEADGVVALVKPLMSWGKTPWRVTGDSAEIGAIIPLLQTSFAFMEGRIDPPSSLHRLTRKAVIGQAETGEIWAIGKPLAACVFLTPKDHALYLGKLAVADAERGKGLARGLVEHAMTRAKALGLAAVELETRIELTENHAAFAAMGFRKAAETAHPGFNRPTAITMRREVS